MDGRIVRTATLVWAMYGGGVLAGIAASRRQSPAGPTLSDTLREWRLQAFRREPLRQVGRALLTDEVARPTALITIVNLGAAAMQFVVGLFFLSPLIAAGQGFLVGSMLSVRRSGATYLFSLLVLVFEAGAFALSSALGMEQTRRWLLTRQTGRPAPGSPLWRGALVVVAMQAIGGLIEAVGATKLRIPGVLAREQLAHAVGMQPGITP